jgi:hypothetical protein
MQRRRRLRETEGRSFGLFDDAGSLRPVHLEDPDGSAGLAQGQGLAEKILNYVAGRDPRTLLVARNYSRERNSAWSAGTWR